MRINQKIFVGMALVVVCGGMLVFAGGVASASTTHSQGSRVRFQPPELPTFNWAGYVQNGSSGQFTAVRDQWKVSKVDPIANGNDYYAQQLVGIGGYSGSDSTLLEAGTETDDLNGAVVYEAFVETSTSGEEVLSGVPVQKGNIVRATIKETSTNEWLLEVMNVTTGRSGSVTVNYDSSEESAEAVLARPCLEGNCTEENSGLANLASTNNVTFTTGKVSTSGPGHPTWGPLMTAAGSATVDNLFMKNDAGNQIIATASNPSTNNEGFTAADGAEQPPPPSS
jgi:hypothetical protein